MIVLLEVFRPEVEYPAGLAQKALASTSLVQPNVISVDWLVIIVPLFLVLVRLPGNGATEEQFPAALLVTVLLALLERIPNRTQRHQCACPAHRMRLAKEVLLPLRAIAPTRRLTESVS